MTAISLSLSLHPFLVRSLSIPFLLHLSIPFLLPISIPFLLHLSLSIPFLPHLSLHRFVVPSHSPSFVVPSLYPFLVTFLSLSILSCPISLSLHHFQAPSLSIPFLSHLFLSLFGFISLQTRSPSFFVRIEPATTDVKSHVHTSTPLHPPLYKYSKHYIITLIHSFLI